MMKFCRDWITDPQFGWMRFWQGKTEAFCAPELLNKLESIAVTSGVTWGQVAGLERPIDEPDFIAETGLFVMEHDYV